eukprot:m.23692 g.23692  ORF g.23692 m.23692 type:complete len:569 (+) comp5573_c0_seq2:48-1754(+)
MEAPLESNQFASPSEDVSLPLDEKHISSTSLAEMSFTKEVSEVQHGGTVDFLRIKVKDMLSSFAYASAAFWANKLVTMSNGSIEDVYLLAQSYLHLGESERAAHTLIRFNTIQKSLACRFFVARCYLACTKFIEALNAIGGDDEGLCLLRDLVQEEKYTWFQPIQELDSRVWLLRGTIFEAMDNRNKATTCYVKSLELDPFCAEALMKIEEHDLLTPKKQIATYSSVLEEKNLPSEINECIVHCYNSMCEKHELEKKDEGPSDLEKALAENSDIMVFEATRLFNRGKFDECLELSSRVLDTDKFHEKCLPVHISCLVELQEVNTLFYLAHQLVDANPEKAIPWFAVASYYFATKYYDKARQYYTKATQIDINFGVAWLGIAHSYAIQNEHDQAMTAYFYAARTMSGNHTPFLYLGMEYSQTKNDTMALKFYRKALSICPNDAAIFHEIGVLFLKDGNLEKAKTTFETAIKLHKKNGIQPKQLEATLVNLGRVYLQMGSNYEDAEALYTEALDLIPDSEVAIAGLAFSLHCLGNLDDAINYYHKVLALNPLDSFSESMLTKALTSVSII